MSEHKTVTADFLKKEFENIYGKGEAVRVFAAPARINIIGEHIDYNGGFVFPAAINKYLYTAIRKRSDTKILYQDLFFPGKFTFDINEELTCKKENDYANILNGILSEMKKKGLAFDSGFEVLIASNVPSAGGISSSSALECGFAWAVNCLFNFKLSRKEIAIMGQNSEHNFLHLNCGIMDQYIIATGKEKTAELLDCAKIEHTYVPLNLGDYRFVVMNTKKQRKLADSKYNERRSQCETALKIINAANKKQYKDLCSISGQEFSEIEKNWLSLCKTAALPEVVSAGPDSPYYAGTILKRARHCVTENQRVLQAVEALKTDNLPLLGKLMVQSHMSLKNDYESSGIELDTLVEQALKVQGCLGARMTGAGFGGCAIALVHKASTETLMNQVQENYTKIIGYPGSFFECESGDGVKEI